MNVYGFSDIDFNDEGGASFLVEKNGVVFAIPVVTPEPGQTVGPFSETGNPAGLIVKQADEQLVWVFVLHNRLFATKNPNANPHELWLSWAFCRPHAVQRFTGLKVRSTKMCRRPLVVDMNVLALPAEGETATGNASLDEALRKNKHPISPGQERLVVFRDRMYEMDAKGACRRLRGAELALAQKILLAAA